MVGFKKDKGKKEKLDSFLSYIVLFSAGFIIATFVVLYIVMFIVNHNIYKENNNNQDSDIPSSNSEVIDEYKSEKEIINNLLSICQAFDSGVNDILYITYDTSNMYVGARDSDHNLYLLSGELNDRKVNEVLESLMTSSSSFEITGYQDIFDRNELPSIDISTLSSFKNNELYKDYTYRCKCSYFTDGLYDQVGMSLIGYKNNEYIVIMSISYQIDTETLNDVGEGYLIKSNNINEEYYKVISYLYNK